MSNFGLISDVIRKIRYRLARRTVLFNVCDASVNRPKALLHYKTEPFFDPRSVSEYRHTNSWEIVELCRILDKMGYSVDVVDRTERDWVPKDEYVLVIGNASGNSGLRYPFYCRATPSAEHILYATGPNPQVANGLRLARYDALFERTGIRGAPLRVMDAVDMDEIFRVSQAALVLDGNGFSTECYGTAGIPVHNFTPSVSPLAEYSTDWFESRQASRFLCFAGNGFVSKGVDLVVEAFLELPELQLTIAGPEYDPVFWEAYGDSINDAANITYAGFVQIGSAKYREICSTHSWSVHPSAAESACTSVATTMRSGIVPVVTRESSIDVADFGVLLPSEPDEIISQLKTVARALAELSGDEYARMVEKTVDASDRFTQNAYSESVSSALRKAISLPI